MPTSGSEALSERGVAVTKPMLSYLTHFFKTKERTWTPQDPEGYIALVVAENRLSFDILRPRVQANLQLPEEIECYNSFSGDIKLRSKIGELLSRTLLLGKQVQAEDLCISAGCGAIIDNLFFCIAEPGTSVLIPAPYYPAFDNDLRAKDGLVAVPVHMPGLGMLCVRALEAAYQESVRDGRAASSLLLTNPNNPLGTVYRKEDYVAVMAWAFMKGLHVVSDEIYAWSVFQDKECFVSAPMLLEEAAAQASVDATAASHLLHVISAFSKDFCMSGFRVGWVYSRNKALLEAMGNVGYFNSASNVTQHALACTLEDACFIDAFMEENCRRLNASYSMIRDALVEANIPFTHAQAAMFMCIDLSAYLRENTFGAERELFEALFNEEKLLLTPGNDCHFKNPGNFRMCYAAVPPACLPVAMTRLIGFLKTRWPIIKSSCSKYEPTVEP
mmetsp:Transcript_10087/g.19020  ORF Transcript_10087/g.19020 Transcript_10087/m.19020 type:complete len:445 (-) Transcript_10087:258-1592(-)|eukprot:CAMPEP_0114238714 /NCGR_PEP_ID=MMETSP0058-20121206/8067_1 /TAXON_ID=36894 /ORGANISM="Pyramimonas parkeae, CCMP726" /LENGTH=444 /DNA_ID=CAMNT_0001350833 /DNA_START=194 /DNA_END=1528 /DNA_ORIENTATION=+